jgi:hypothetical protein
MPVNRDERVPGDRTTRQYSRPVLTCYGSVVKLTLGKGSGGADKEAGMIKVKP